MDLNKLFQMTEKNWEDWEKIKVNNIPLPLFESLVNAINLLIEGKRLNEDEKQSWLKSKNESNEILDKIYEKNFKI